MNSQWWRFVAEISPGLTLSLVASFSALTPCVLLRQSGRGRARSAIAYLSGLAAGLAMSVALAFIFTPLVRASVIAEAGLLGAFFGPFAGMVRAKWQRPRRRTRRSAGRSLSRPSWAGFRQCPARPLSSL